MFKRKRKTFFIYLKSGQVIPVKAEECEIKWSKATEVCSSLNFENMSPKMAIPIWIKLDEIIAVTQKGV